MNNKTKNQVDRKNKKTSVNLVRVLSFRPCIKVNKIFKESLACGLIISVLLCLYFAQDSAFAQIVPDNSLIVGKATSSDGSVHVTIISTPIVADKPLALQISFTDSRGNLIPYENYGIRAQQMESNGVLILSNSSALAANGKDIQVTTPLENVSPVNFQVQLQGSGAPDASISEWTGPNEIVSITIGQQYSARTAVSQAPSGTQQVITIPYGAYNPRFDTSAPNWYQPSTITINVNQSVTWINQDTESHTVTSGKAAGRVGLLRTGVGQPDGLFNSGLINIGQSWTHKFTKVGTFEYFCTLHPWMQGYIIVTQGQPNPVDADGNKITKFPVVRLTPDRTLEADLDWEPHYITTGQNIIFIYQFYDNIKFEAIPAHYVFTITQDGQQLYKIDDSTQFGGAYQYFRFDKPGPVTFEFDDIARTGQSVQYSTIVEPGNSTDTGGMDMPMVEPARNLELSWWLMPLFFVPCFIAIGVIYFMKSRKRRVMTSNRILDKKTPI